MMLGLSVCVSLAITRVRDGGPGTAICEAGLRTASTGRGGARQGAAPPISSSGGISIQIQFVQSSDFEDNDLWFVPFVQVFDLRRATSESLYSIPSERSTMVRSAV